MANVSTPTVPSTFLCPCGLRHPDPKQYDAELWLESPRTKTRLTIRNGWWHLLPRRLIGRIAKAMSEGRRTVAFTSDELKQFVAVHQDMQARLASCISKPSQTKLWGGWRDDYRWAKRRSYRR